MWRCVLLKDLWLTWVSWPCSEDRAALAKLVEAIKTNYNDRYEEVSALMATIILDFFCPHLNQNRLLDMMDSFRTFLVKFFFV